MSIFIVLSFAQSLPERNILKFSLINIKKKKETDIQTPLRWFWGDPSLPSSRSEGFLNKVAILCLNTSPPDLLASCVDSRASLDSVTLIKTLTQHYYYGPAKA